MLKISKAQLASFEAAIFEQFVSAMVIHLRATFADELGGLSIPELKESILRAITQAGAYGIINARDACLYLGLVFTFGEDFDQQHTWASSILRNPWYLDSTSRIDALYEAALEHAS